MNREILVIGYGSIGRRHVQNILELGYKNISVVQRRSTQDNPCMGLPCFASVEEAYQHKSYDDVFICTPTARHMTDLDAVWEQGARNIYLEKPISNTFDNVELFLQKIKDKNARIIMGYDLHFDPGLMKAKEIINSGVLGKVLSANALVGQYLPDWRPHTNYLTGMSVRIDKGGGVMLDLIHEMDYLYDMLGEVHLLTAQIMNSNTLEIETEDLAEIFLRYENGAIATIHLDYLQPTFLRYCRFTCSQGSILWDMAHAEVRWINRDKETFHFSYKDFQRNDRFKNILKTFLEGTNDSRLTTYEKGMKSLAMTIAAKKAAKENTWLFFKNFKP